MIYSFASFELDTRLYELRQDKEPCRLEPQVFDVLCYLVQHRDRVISKNELFEQVWGDRIVTESALSSRLKAARKAIGDSGREQRLIKTLHGRGYRFIGEVVEMAITAEMVDPATAEPLPQAALTLSEMDAVGRETELQSLADHLSAAQAGVRQLVFITGEAGLGKTTVVDSFLEAVRAQNSTRILAGHCLEQHGPGEAYLPLLEAMGRACQETDAAEVIDLLKRRAPSWLIEMPWVVEAEVLTDLQQTTRGMTRDRMMREMVETLEDLSSQKPLILVLEDLHWSDSSTVDFLAWLANRTEPARLLVIGTYRGAEVRADEHPLDTVAERLKIRGGAAEISLSLLDTTSVAQYLQKRLPGAEIPDGLSAMLQQRTEGNPLFMGSVLDHWIARGSVAEHDGTWCFEDDLEALSSGVPESLRLLIERRLADLPETARNILEAASVLGRDFPAAAIAAVVDVSEDEIETTCAGLVRDGTFLELCGTAAWPDGTVTASFRFVHDLFQEVLYERVPVGRRTRLHSLIGDRLETAYGAEAADQAAELVAHFLAGRNVDKALVYLRLAAKKALHRLAQPEAAAHLKRGLELLPELEDKQKAKELELSFQAALAPTLIVLEGFRSKEAEAAYQRARELCEELDDRNQLSAVLYGLAIQCELRGEFRRSQALMEERLEIDQEAQEPAVVEVETYDLLACSYLHQARYPHALALAEAGIKAYDQQCHSDTASSYGENPGIACRAWAGLSHWFMGYPDKALEVAREAVRLSEEPGQAYSLSNSMMQLAGIYQLRRDTASTRYWAEETIKTAQADGFTMRVAVGQIYKGWARAVDGESDEIDLLKDGLDTLEAIGAGLDRPYFLALLAEALAFLGRPEEALETVDETLGHIEPPQSHFYESELYRLRGELILKSNSRAGEDAATSFRKALDLASEQEGLSIQLRAATSLAERSQELGTDKKEGQEILAPIYQRFSEGFDTPDLIHASRILDEIGST